MPVRLALLAMCVIGLGCSNHSPFACSAASQCVDGDRTGVCTQGYCAFADPMCSGGYRFDTTAGGGLAGMCLESDAGVAACGAIGQACCVTGSACTGGASCEGGTCQSCITDLALGRRFSCTIARDHTVWCSGENTVGQLGIGLAGVASTAAVQVHDASSAVISDATALGAGREHVCAIRAGGTVWCWGRNESGEIGNGTTSPSVPAAAQVIEGAAMPLAGMVEVVAGGSFACARDGSGGVWCWGYNGNGRLGDGTTTSRSTAAPVLVAMGGAAFTGATGLAAGDEIACALKGGAAWCWGRNDRGELGDGTKTDHLVPVMIASTTSVAPGMRHLCVVDADSTISCAGSRDFSRLGTGSGGGFNSGSDQVTPVEVLTSEGGAPFGSAAQVFAGGESCALMQDTSVYCWGDSRYGQIGIGAGATVPAQVHLGDQPLDKVDRVVAHYAHVCVHRTSGEWLCWGRNTEGELGDGTTDNRGFPTPTLGSCP